MIIATKEEVMTEVITEVMAEVTQEVTEEEVVTILEEDIQEMNE
jgi:hypothetical protein